MICGVALHLAADRAFLRAGTTRATRGRPEVLVTGGVFRWSRNPMYLGGALFLMGSALALGPVAGMLAVPVYLLLVKTLYIAPEEEVLVARFGEAYEAYRSRVRRWI